MAGEVRVERGIYRAAGGGWRVYVSINGRLVARRFPADWTLTKVRRARERLDVRLRDRAAATHAPDRPDAGTFAQDAALYLKAVRSMPTFKQRQTEIGRWVGVFGPRRRDTITRIDIDVILQRWLADGYAGSTVKKWRTALMHLWSRLDGKGAANPVKSSFLPDEADADARGLPAGMVRVILRLMRPSPTRARLAVMAYVGLAPLQIANLQPKDLDLAGRTLWVRARKKGKGAAGFPKPLSSDGVAAMRTFAACNAWTPPGQKPYSASSAYASFKRAAAKLGLLVGPGGLRPYDLKHTYVTELYDASGDLRATQIVAGHRSLTTTARYALRAVDVRARAAVAAVDARQNLPGELTGDSNPIETR